MLERVFRTRILCGWSAAIILPLGLSIDHRTRHAFLIIPEWPSLLVEEAGPQQHSGTICRCLPHDAGSGRLLQRRGESISLDLMLLGVGIFI